MRPELSVLFETPKGEKIIALKPLSHRSEDQHIKIVLCWEKNNWKTAIYNENFEETFWAHHFELNLKNALENFRTRNYLAERRHGPGIQRTIKDLPIKRKTYPLTPKKT